MNENKKVKPKQYSHIDYEAILIYSMKNRVSIDDIIKKFNLDIARSTLIRNISKLKAQNKDNEIISFYQDVYVPNMQKKELPEYIAKEIDSIEDRPIIIKKSELEDLYKKLSDMKNIVESCGNNVSIAARVINSGNTILGNIKISTQGLRKNLKRYEIVKREYEKQNTGEKADIEKD